MGTINVTLPNGKVIKNIPEGTPKDEIRRKAVAAGMITDAEFEGVEAGGFEAKTPPPGFAPPEHPLIMRETEGGQPAPEPEEEYTGVEATQELRPYEGDASMLVRARVAAEPVLDEIKRSWWGNLILPSAQTALDFWNMAAEVLNGGTPVSQETKDRQQAVLLDQVRRLRGEVSGKAPSITVVASQDGKKSAFQLDEDGRVVTERAQTLAGEILPYFVPGVAGFKVLASANMLRKLSDSARIGIASVASSNIAGQLLTDPYADLVANTLEDFLSESGSHSAIISYLASDEEDEMHVRRLKMMGQDTILGLFIDGGIVGTSKFASWVKSKASSNEMFKRVEGGGITTLSEDELGEFFYQFMKDSKAEGRNIVDLPTGADGKPLYISGRPNYELREEGGAGVFRPEFLNRMSREGLENTNAPLGTGVFAQGDIERRLADEELAQIAAQSGNGIAPNLRRFVQQVFTPNGYWTDTLFYLKGRSESSKRAIVNRGEGIARRINISLDRMVRQALDPSNPYQIPNVENREQASAYFQEQVGLALRGNESARDRLPRQVLDEIDSARASIDSLSLSLVDSPTVFEEFKDDVLESVGSYLKRSFEIFENPNYVANREPATEYFRTQFLADGLSEQEAATQAAARVDGILANASEGYSNFLTNSQRLNNNIYARREDIPEPIRQLLGEIKDPARDVVLTITRLANFVETDKFLREFDQYGRGSFVLDEPSGIYSARISGTNSPLDGRYTTPELKTALLNQQSRFDWMDSGLVRSLATYKAATQTAKTIVSHTTHAKNFLGATMGRMANGSLPFTRESANAFRVVYNNAKGNGDKALDDLAEEYIRLNVMSTNVGVRELRDLMDMGYGDPEGLLKWANIQAEKAGKAVETVSKIGTKGASKTYSSAEKIYMGVDDFFKIAEFEDYASVLAEAYPTLTRDQTRQMAADTIKRVLINYDMVPQGIKQIRFLPLGSFVGFPAEVMRTAIQIPMVAFEEISSGNDVLVKRGIQRLVGWGATAAGGGSLVSYTTAALSGATSEQMEALKEYHRTDWSPNPTPWVSRDWETGELMSMDANSLDTYQYFREPFRAIMSAIQTGTAREEDILDIVVEGAGNAFKGMVSPFISESMSTELWTDYLSALKSSDGRGISGKLFFEDGKTGIDAVWEGLKTLYETLEPGSVASLERYFEETGEDVREWQGDPTEPDVALAAQFGLPIRRVRPTNVLSFGTRDYASAQRDAPRVSVNYRSTPEEVIQKYVALNKSLYDAQVDLRAKALMAIDLGMSWVDVHSALESSGIEVNTAREILDGNFVPAPLGNELWERISREVFHAGKLHNMSFSQLRLEISKLQDTMRFTPLDKAIGQDTVANAAESVDEQRRPFSKGGVVVPNAPTFPSQRVDKLTGLPYFLQAGQPAAEGTLMEALKVPRQGFQAGGIVKALAKRFLKQADEVVEATPPPPSRPVERPATTVAPSPEYQEGVEKFGEEGMTTEARMARGDAMNMDPAPYYHGTAADIEAFSSNFLGEMTGADSAKMGFFFSRSSRTAGTYADWAGRKAEQGALLEGEEAATAGANVLPVRLRMERPKLVEMNFTTHDTPNRPRLSEEIAKAKEEGYDSVVFRNFSDHVDVKDINARMIEFLDQMPEDRFSEDTRKLVDWVVGNPKDLSYWRFDKLNAVIRDLSGAARRGQENFDAWYKDEGLFKRNGITTPEQAQKLHEDLSYLKKELTDKYLDYTDHVVVFDPSQIRSVNATFDPAHRESGNLLRATTIAPAGGILEALRQASQVGSEEDI